ncbi:hypothetical protein [Mycobacterium sp. 94-17]|nr:hypothetical protein [Mycobacterium sp. 94-17]MEB4210560.1 hypothetical protein [Mycobacterium sp. 94-17]
MATSVPGVDWAPGEYYAKGKVGKANRAANDAVLARRLWEHTMARLA